MQISNIAKKLPFFPKKGRSPKKFRELFHLHIKSLYNLALRYTGNRFDAEDLVQESFYTAYKNFHQLRYENKFKSWLITIMRNIYLKDQKRQANKSVLEFDESIDYVSALETVSEKIDIEKTYEKKVAYEQIQRILNKLPEKYKLTVLLYYMEDISYQEISDMLKIPMGTVMSRLSRGKQILKKEMLLLALSDSVADNVVNIRSSF